MMRKLMGLTAGLILATALVAAEDPTKGKAKLEPVSLTVARKLDAKQFPFSGASTSTSFLLTYPGKHFLTLDPKTKVSEFADDKGNSLLGGGFFKPSFYMQNVSPDRSAAVIVLHSSGASPAKGASKVILKGNLVLVCGLEEKTTEAADVTLKAKTEVKKGDFTITVNQEKGFGEAGASLNITSKQAVKNITAKDADGKAIDTLSSNHYYNTFAKTWNYYITLKKVHKEAKISITYFSKEEKVEVPVDLSIGLGL